MKKKTATVIEKPSALDKRDKAAVRSMVKIGFERKEAKELVEQYGGSGCYLYSDDIMEAMNNGEEIPDPKGLVMINLIHNEKHWKILGDAEKYPDWEKPLRRNRNALRKAVKMHLGQ